MKTLSAVAWGPRGWIAGAWAVVTLQLGLVMFLGHAAESYPESWNTLEIGLEREVARMRSELLEVDATHDRARAVAPIGAWTLEIEYESDRIVAITGHYRMGGSERSVGFIVLHERPEGDDEADRRY